MGAAAVAVAAVAVPQVAVRAVAAIAQTLLFKRAPMQKDAVAARAARRVRLARLGGRHWQMGVPQRFRLVCDSEAQAHPTRSPRPCLRHHGFGVRLRKGRYCRYTWYTVAAWLRQLL